MVHWRFNRGLPSDAPIFFDAVRRARAGLNPYEPFSIGTSFVYPPAALPFFLPFADLSPRTALILWGVVGVALYGGSVLLLAWRGRTILGGGIGRWIALVALAATYAPFLESARVGQTNSLVLFGVVLFLVGLEAPRGRWIGDAGLAVAISIKMSPAVLLALPVARGDAPRVARVLAALALVVGCSFLFFPTRLWSDFADVLPGLLAPYDSLLNHAPGPTLSYLAQQAGGNPSGGALAGRAFTVCVLLVWIAVAVARRTSPPVVLALLGVVTMTLGSGLVWFHHLVLLVPALFLVPARLGQSRPAVLAAAAGSLALIQANRLLELALRWPPVASVAGCLLIYAATLLVAAEDQAPGVAP